MPEETRDEVKKLLIDLIRSDPEVHAALRVWEREEARCREPQVAAEIEATFQRTLDRKYRI